jgi:hypothetical protein
MSTARLRCLGSAGGLGLFALALIGQAARADLPEVVFEITAQAGSVSATIPILADSSRPTA